MRLVVVGDGLLDRDVLGTVERVAPDAPVPVVDVERTRERPGGAGLAALLLAGRGAHVTLASCAGADSAGTSLRSLLADAGVEHLSLAPVASTRVLTRVRAGGQSLVRLDDPAPRLERDAEVHAGALDAAIRNADAVLVADYGGGLTSHPVVRDILARWAPRRPVVWDPHPRGAEPVPGVTAATPNRCEALSYAPNEHGDLDGAAAQLRERWQARGVVATDGSAGAVTLLAESPPLLTPAPRVSVGDPCGAGDRFAGTLALALARGAVITEAVGEAVLDVAAWLDAGGVAALDIPAPEPPGVPEGGSVEDVVAGVRARGGTVVATGGCFDVLHAGHVACLEAARRLGDCLVVLLNSDASVTRLKGPERPVHDQEDRARVLLGLGCVDAVVVFEEDSPHAALERLRPDVWAKGGDYAAATLPEAPLVRSWGGRVVLLPYLPGRSTTRILEKRRAS
jgi:D-beta-D-heptose 7-phosphate kinase/D-beta-D-heptose 1-phosphate adenosyltransferase